LTTTSRCCGAARQSSHSLQEHGQRGGELTLCGTFHAVRLAYENVNYMLFFKLVGEAKFMKNRLVPIGIVGSVVAAFCCFTPLLPVVLGGLGLTGVLSIIYNDAVLLPLLAVFLILTGYAIWRQKKQK
jgi:mercuric ion transport protein